MERHRSRTPWLGRKVPALGHDNYRLFFGGQLISVTGTWMASLAQSWLVLTLSGSAFYLGLVPVAQFVPAVILGMYGGALADRFSKRKILVITQFSSAVLSLALAVLIFADRIQLWHVFLSAALLGVVGALDTPARQAFVSEMVPKEDLVQAVSLNSAIFNAGRLIGPALAGVVLAAVGAGWCFFANGVSFFAVIIQLMRMDERKLFQSAVRRTGNSIREGISYSIHHPIILRTVLIIGVVSMFTMNFNVWMPLLAKDTFDIGASGFGLMMSLLGFGSLAGALVLAFIGKKRPSPTIIALTGAALAIVLIMIGLDGTLAGPPLVAMLLLPFGGFAMTFTGSMANSTIQMEAPDHMRGRVMAFYFMVFNTGLPLGALIAGTTSEHFGPSGSMIFGAILSLIGTGAVVYLTVFHPRSRSTSTPKPITSTTAD